MTGQRVLVYSAGHSVRKRKHGLSTDCVHWAYGKGRPALQKDNFELTEGQLWAYRTNPSAAPNECFGRMERKSPIGCRMQTAECQCFIKMRIKLVNSGRRKIVDENRGFTTVLYPLRWSSPSSYPQAWDITQRSGKETIVSPSRSARFFLFS